MRADFRVKFEVEVRGLTALFLYAAYRRHAVSPVSRRGGICEKPRATLPRALSCRIPFFCAGAKYHGIHHASRRPTAVPILRVGREGRRAGRVRTKRADNVEVPKLLRTFAMIETYGN